MKAAPVPIKMLIIANVAAMFRDFLNPFGQYFREKGWRVDAMAADLTQADCCKGYFDNLWDVKWSRNPFAVGNYTNAPKAFLRTVEEVGYDLIHVHTPIPSFISRCASSRIPAHRRPKIVYTAHGFHFHAHGNSWKNKLFLVLEKIAGRWTDRLVVINREDEESAQNFHLVPERKILFMPGIGIERSDYDRQRVSEEGIRKLRAELTVNEGDPLFLMLAEFSPGKRHRDAIAALANLRNSRSHLILAGEGPLRAEMTALCERLNVKERVHFVGFRKDVPTLLAASSASILPSEREGLPKSIMEALSMTVPVIGTDIRGIHDLLSNGAGVLVPVGDVQQLAGAMDWVLNHPKDARDMARVGVSRMGPYERKHILGLHERLYADLLS